MPASPVAISAVSRTSNVVTVTTSAAHGLVANQGFSTSGITDTSFNINATVATVPDSTHFTFSQVGANASSSGGSVLPAKEVIVLDVALDRNNQLFVRYLLWLTTTVPVAKPNSVSQWPGASAAETNALSVGTTVEVPRQIPFPTTLTKAQIQLFLQNDFTAEQSAFASSTQPGQFFGGFFDGVGWSF